MKQLLADKFPPEYWELWGLEYGHNFFDTHWQRTEVYSDMFGNDLTGKRVLEVGGFPGLAMAMYEEHHPSHITSIDSPNACPDYYKEWAKSRGIEVVVHDIVNGAPDIRGRWDIAIMSDVLLHVNGFPIKFYAWLLTHCSAVYLINYQGSTETLINATESTLKSGFPIPRKEIMITLAEAFGATAIGVVRVDDRREMIKFRGRDE